MQRNQQTGKAGQDRIPVPPADLLAHGFQTLIHTAPGAGLFPFLVEDSLIGFLEQSSRFLKPVYADDTLYPALEVTELAAARSTGVVTLRSTVFNQRRERVLEGMQKFLIRRRPQQSTATLSSGPRGRSRLSIDPRCNRARRFYWLLRIAARSRLSFSVTAFLADGSDEVFEVSTREPV
jgi:hypothetical protein